VRQVRAQVVPSHVVVPLGSVAQGVQLVPHDVIALSDWQVPEQRWFPVLQTQACAAMSQVSFDPHWVSNAQPALQRPLERSQ
jgi:hypothetical protein